MDRSQKTLPAELMAARRKAIIEKALQRRKTAAQIRNQKQHVAGAPLAMQRPPSPATSPS